MASSRLLAAPSLAFPLEHRRSFTTAPGTHAPWQWIHYEPIIKQRCRFGPPGPHSLLLHLDAVGQYLVLWVTPDLAWISRCIISLTSSPLFRRRDDPHFATHRRQGFNHECGG
jgi:hypothetical protein